MPHRCVRRFRGLAAFAGRVPGAAVFGVAALVGLSAVAASAQVTFQDGTWDAADWTTNVFFTSGNLGTGTADQTIVGGNPGSFRQVTHTIGTRPAQVALVHERAGATYDPQTQGAVVTIGFAFDAKTLSDPGYGGQSASLAVIQDDVVYCGPFFANGSAAWLGTSHTDLVATDFTVFMGVGQPDFSATGSTLRFGLVTSNTNPPNGIVGQSVTIVGYDNWSVTIASAASAVHPGSTAAQLAHSAAPTPFGFSTVIRFVTERPAQVLVTIFDVAGREVRQLNASTLPTGSHAMTWDGRDASGRQAPTGAYFYRIEAADRFATGRLTLVR